MELYPGYLEDHFRIHKLSAPDRYMTAAASAGAMGMGVYDRRHQPLAAAVAMEPMPEAKFTALVEDDVHVHVPVQEPPPPQSSPESFHHHGGRPRDKVQRRLAQNREAARKSRLRKKAYIHNLQTSRMKLAQLELELTRTRQQGLYIGGGGDDLPVPIDPGVVAFEMEYAQWVEEQGRQTGELRAALQAAAPEPQLRVLVGGGLAHYERLFRAKSAAAKTDVFFVMSGAWRTPVERLFLWIGGFRPSELLKILAPELGTMSEQKQAAVRRLQQTARQAEEALSHGMERLQQTLAESLTTMVPAATDDDQGPDGGGGYYMAQMATAMGSLDALVGFVDQADNLRQVTLQNMYKILTVQQAARGLLALGDYCQRLRALSSLWAARPREPA